MTFTNLDSLTFLKIKTENYCPSSEESESETDSKPKLN